MDYLLEAITLFLALLGTFAKGVREGPDGKTVRNRYGLPIPNSIGWIIITLLLCASATKLYLNHESALKVKESSDQTVRQLKDTNQDLKIASVELANVSVALMAENLVWTSSQPYVGVYTRLSDHQTKACSQDATQGIPQECLDAINAVTDWRAYGNFLSGLDRDGKLKLYLSLTFPNVEIFGLTQTCHLAQIQFAYKCFYFGRKGLADHYASTLPFSSEAWSSAEGVRLRDANNQTIFNVPVLGRDTIPQYFFIVACEDGNADPKTVERDLDRFPIIKKWTVLVSGFDVRTQPSVSSYDFSLQSRSKTANSCTNLSYKRM